MHINQILQNFQPAISFEFFPPKTPESSQSLFESITDLLPLSPAYVSVTYGAGGSTRELTHDLVLRLQKETNLTIIPHLTCVNHSPFTLKNILQSYDKEKVQNVLALRGDLPKNFKSNVKSEKSEEEFKYAYELVSFIKKNFPHLGVGIAGYPEGHPQTPNRLHEMDYLKMKVDAGADYICTQLFFDNNDFYDFCDRCQLAGIKIPIIAGIMPVTSLASLHRMSSLALGTRIPAKLFKAVQRAQTDDQVEQVGIHWATQQVLDLIDKGVSGIHFYTLNKSLATREIYRSLGLTSSKILYDKNAIRV
jgi:methylenetetrahydrofolate reductase (NADPH)